MNRGILKFLLIGFVFFSSTGCTTIVIEGTKAYTQDHSTTMVDIPYAKAWDVASAEVAALGKVLTSSEEEGIIRGMVRDAKVVVVVTPVTEKTTRFYVSARKGLLPQPHIAEVVLSGILRNF